MDTSSNAPDRLEVARARPAPNTPPVPTVTKGLRSWDGVGTVVAAAAVGCVGYVGFTVAQAVSVATAGDPGVSAVADPPPLATYSTDRAATDAPAAAEPAVEPAGQSPRAVPDEAAPAPPARLHPAPEPSARPSTRPSTRAEPGRTRPAAAARTAAAPKRKQQTEIRHAIRADRQLTAMLRGTSQAMLWFGGAPWMTPVVDYHLTARFGESGSLWASTHTGLDFAAPTGTPVRAATAGTVTSVGWAGAYGNKIEITHPDGSQTWYAHLSRTDVQVGSQVGTGTLIGAVGATGNVTGPHLHFEVRPDGDSPVDPEVALQQHGVSP